MSRLIFPGAATAGQSLLEFMAHQMLKRAINGSSLSLNVFDDGWAIGFVFFGIHLVILGYLVFKSGYVPRLLGIVLAIPGVAYVTDSFGKFLLHNHAIELATFVGWGEALFMVWLLYRGLKAPNTSLNTDG